MERYPRMSPTQREFGLVGLQCEYRTLDEKSNKKIKLAKYHVCI